MHTAAATAIQTVRTSRFELVFTPIAEIGVEERFGWAVALAMRDGADIDAFVDSLPPRGLREFARRRRLVCLRHAAGSGRGAGGAHLMIDAMPDCFENPAAELEALVHGVPAIGPAALPSPDCSSAWRNAARARASIRSIRVRCRIR